MPCNAHPVEALNSPIIQPKGQTKMNDSYSDLESAKAGFAEAIHQLAKEIDQYEVASRLDEAEIAKLHKIKHDLISSFKVVADAAKGRP